MAGPDQAHDTGVDGPTSAGALVLRDRYEIHPGSPLTPLDTPSARAYAALDRRNPSRALYALVCDPSLPPRTHVIDKLRRASLPGLLPLLANGPIDGPGSGGRRLAAVYHQPLGGSLADPIERASSPLSDHELPKRVISPLFKGLQGLERHGLAHRAIRPENLHFVDKTRQELVLGDCVTAPAGFDQPVVFETIERGMAAPDGRGEGSVADDIYALGITLIMLILGRNPVAHLSDDEVLAAKIEKGSYNALCERERVPLAFIELLRSLVCDDPQQRWGLFEIERWLSGHRMTPPRRVFERKAGTPFTFAGCEYTSARMLAHALSKRIPEAARVIREGELGAWLDLRLKNPKLARGVAEALAVARANAEGARGSDDHLVARVAMILDPAGPIRFRSMAFMIDGLGPAMAATWLRDGDAQTPAQVLTLGLPALWLSEHAMDPAAASEYTARFARLGHNLEQRGPGWGLERCLYEANRGLPCQSPLVAEAFVDEIQRLLPALEAAAEAGVGDRKPVDRHVAAFIAARFDAHVEPFMDALADARDERCLLGMLGLLAMIQHRLKVQPLPNLCAWFGDRLGPVIDTYYARTLRAEIGRHLPKVTRQGSLPELYNLIENPERRRYDRKAFTAAAAEFAAAETEIQSIESGELAGSEASRMIEQRWAATTSVSVSAAAAGIIVFLTLG